jgi:hypothetical protein
MLSRPIRRLGWFVILVTALACSSQGLSRVAVRGKVTCDGVPVKRGMITFRPTSELKGPAAGTAIIDGKFVISAEKGPTVGPHEVEIKIAHFVTNDASPDQPALALRGTVQFKTFSQRVTVKTRGNEFDFALSSDSPNPKAKQP